MADQRNIFQTNAHKYVTDAHKKGTGLIHAATGARDVVRKGIIHRHALDSVRNAMQRVIPRTVVREDVNGARALTMSQGGAHGNVRIVEGITL